MIDCKFVDENCCGILGGKDEIKRGIEERDRKIDYLEGKVEFALTMATNAIELNMSNYTHNDVERLNDEMIALHEYLSFKVDV